MTGIDDIETARIVFESIIQKMKDCHRENPELNILGDCNACHLRNFEVHMLNSDFDAGFIIHRENLSHILRERYHLICRYESTR